MRKLLWPLLMLALLGSQPLVAATTDTMPSTTNNMSTTVDDSAIISAITNKLATDPMTKDLSIKVTSQNGIVTLTGNVNTNDEASTAIQIAESTNGVSNVNTDNLTVQQSNQIIADSVITAKVKGLFIRENLIGSGNVAVTTVNVTTTNGIVYLSGTVSTQQQADNAVRLAKSVDGVKSVQSKLVIKSS